jgi:hypothetical protein
VNLGGNSDHRQMKGMWRLTLANIRDGIDYCEGMLEEESGRDMSGPCPIPSLGETH